MLQPDISDCETDVRADHAGCGMETSSCGVCGKHRTGEEAFTYRPVAIQT